MASRQSAKMLADGTFSSYRNGWRARVKFKGEEVYLGTFKTKEEAEYAEDEFRAHVAPLRDMYKIERHQKLK